MVVTIMSSYDHVTEVTALSRKLQPCYGSYDHVTEVTTMLQKLRPCHGSFGHVTKVSTMSRKFRPCRKNFGHILRSKPSILAYLTPFWISVSSAKTNGTNFGPWFYDRNLTLSTLFFRSYMPLKNHQIIIISTLITLKTFGNVLAKYRAHFMRGCTSGTVCPRKHCFLW